MTPDRPSRSSTCGREFDKDADGLANEAMDEAEAST
jgi:hypothetical protein